MLLSDVRCVEAYRKRSGPVTADTLKARFPGINDGLARLIVADWIDEERDFIYTCAGLQILVNRYLYENEPIQCAMLRFAEILTGGRVLRENRLEELRTLRVFYDLISCGIVHVSSIMAASDQADTDNVMPGEACRLMVATEHYDHRLILQLEKLCTLISLGVGVGFGVSTVPRFGSVERGQIRSGLRAIAKKINSCNHVTLHERRPKTALYLHIHNDTFFEILDLKMPSKAPLDNVFFGLFVPDYFMECVRRDDWWYFFSGSIRNADGKTLADYTGDEYRREFEAWVQRDMYVERRRAREVMQLLLKCLLLTGSPYVIWSDTVNRYNNQAHLGPVKTLNLCAEITNHATAERSSSCTLLSCNMAMYRDFPQVVERANAYMHDICNVRYECEDFGGAEDVELARFAFMVGYLGTVMLNRLLGDKRECREIGLNLLGVYDMALLADRHDHVNVCALVSEALYKGAVHSSCDWSRRTGTRCANYLGSHFSHGRPQWALRGVSPRSDWTQLQYLMCHGMANSMLTAQAPTATTCLLAGVSESVVLPMSTLVTKESENGRNRVIVYGEVYRNYAHETLRARDFDDQSFYAQLAMYEASAPYVDQSQSTMFPVRLNTQEVYDLIVATYRAGLKTGIYYLLYRQCRPTLDIVKSRRRRDVTLTVATSNDSNDDSTSSTKLCPSDCDSCSL